MIALFSEFKMELHTIFNPPPPTAHMTLNAEPPPYGAYGYPASYLAHLHQAQYELPHPTPAPTVTPPHKKPRDHSPDHSHKDKNDMELPDVEFYDAPDNPPETSTHPMNGNSTYSTLNCNHPTTTGWRDSVMCPLQNTPQAPLRCEWQSLFSNAFSSSRQYQCLPPADIDTIPNDPCSDSLNTNFNGLNVWSNNVNTLSLGNDLADLHELCGHFKTYNIGITALQEINVDLTQASVYQSVKAIFDLHF
jgi:hypothetical protein